MENYIIPEFKKTHKDNEFFKKFDKIINKNKIQNID